MQRALVKVQALDLEICQAIARIKARLDGDETGDLPQSPVCLTFRVRGSVRLGTPPGEFSD